MENLLKTVLFLCGYPHVIVRVGWGVDISMSYTMVYTIVFHKVIHIFCLLVFYIYNIFLTL